MKTAKTYSVAIGCVISFLCFSLAAQQTRPSIAKVPGDEETTERLANYQELKRLGYSEREIFEDLGNANFLSERYETALFWYDKLNVLSKGNMGNGYQNRYKYALKRTSPGHVPGISDNKDWVASVKSDYVGRKQSLASQSAGGDERFRALDFQQGSFRFSEDQSLSAHLPAGAENKDADGLNLYEAPAAYTKDGNTAYFSKAVYVKPLYGIFSKKELIHKIYKAEKINGQWQSIQEVALGPKNSSTIHPSISEDGNRLFFASDMPGTFGKYDIYVADINNDGSFGIPKNLGEKVNTDTNDLYPNVNNNSTLFFASEGRKGFGGLDVYMAQVVETNVRQAVNLGSNINSAEDDFSILLETGKGMGYVMSNRGSNVNDVQRVAFSYSDARISAGDNRYKHNISEIINADLKVDYSSSVFEDE